MSKSNAKSNEKALIEKIGALEQEIELNKREIASLGKKNEAYRKSESSMSEEIKELHRSIKSYKSANTVLKQRIGELSKEKTELISQHNEDCSRIESLLEQVNKIAAAKEVIESALSASEANCRACEETIAELRRPWWKKIF